MVSSGQGPHLTHFCSLKLAHSNHSNCKQKRSAPVHGSLQHLQAQNPSLGLKQSSSLSPSSEPTLSNCLGPPGNESSSHSLRKELGWARYPQAKCARKKWYSICQRRELPQEAMLLRNFFLPTLVPSPSLAYAQVPADQRPSGALAALLELLLHGKALEWT